MNSAIPADAPKPRHCHVKKWLDFNGYGFNLHAEKNKLGHHIGALDEGSPAEAAGLREGDRIIEVNGTNIANENHQQVVSRIRAVDNEVKLLVVDTEADDYYRERSLVVRGDMAGVTAISTPPTQAAYIADPRAGYTDTDAVPTGDATPAVRLAKLRTWQDFKGYGFNLTSEKAKPCQFIGKVDAASPAATANVFEGDRIVEVNGVNVTDESHHQVVARIKVRSGFVDLLLVDKMSDVFFSSRGTVICGDMPDVVVSETPEHTNESDELEPYFEIISDGSEWKEEKKTVVEEEEEDEPVRRKPTLSDSLPETEPDPAAVPKADSESSTSLAEEEVVNEAAIVDTITMAIASVGSDEPRPRLCHVKKWQTFTGYGFKVQVNRDIRGHFIGNIDVASPAELSGLQKNDRIIEVNGVNIWEDDHNKIVERIKAKHEEVQLLVADEATEKYYVDKGFKIHGSMVQVEKIICPDEEPKAPESWSDGPSPRLCHLKHWPNFQGYGFNLNAEKGRVGNFIGAVEPESPAHATGVRAGDLIIEVNDERVEDASHAYVVRKITVDKTQVKLLLVDASTAVYYKAQGVTVTGNMPAVKFSMCPDRKPESTTATTAAESNGTAEVKVESTLTVDETDHPVSKHGDPMSGSLQDVLNRVKSRKKPQARTGNLSMQEKFALFQEL